MREHSHTTTAVLDYETASHAESGLSLLEEEVLDLEANWWRYRASKATQIRELGLSPVRYYQLLCRLIDTPAAYLYNPMLVKRLLRLRDTNRARYPRYQVAA
ncbi:MAG: DUF3263 domain-containing protein [Propionibacteriaceae bacterium]|jgi:hypothetical protein|nr:DUF3263 domain-containing protein [Propionibacteriaceae bacterium]